MDSPLDAKFIAQLLDQHGKALEFYARQWTDSPEDCVQEAFIQLASRLQPPGPPPDHTLAWLYRVVRNRAKNANRSARRRIHHEQIAAQQTSERRRQAIGDVERLSLLEALDELPVEQRELVVLRTWSKLSWQQIAELIGSSSSTAQRQYVEALKQLRQILEPSCPPNSICPPS